MSEGGIVKRDTVIPGAATTKHDRGARARLGEGLSEQLAFRVADERYALPLGSVREILKLGPITEVPRAPHEMLGILSVRGRVTTVVDLRRRLRVPESPTTGLTRLLLVEGGEEIVGLLVDEVLSVVRLAPDEIEPSQHVGNDVSDHVVAIGRPRVATRGKATKVEEKREREMLILLDPVALLRR